MEANGLKEEKTHCAVSLSEGGAGGPELPHFANRPRRGGNRFKGKKKGERS